MIQKLGLLDLPDEILTTIFNQVPNELKSTCRTFVVMYNDYYMNLFIKRFGLKVLEQINKYDYKYLIDYIKSFDYWRKSIRLIISNYYNLKMNDDNERINCQFIRDSWKLIYGIYMNRRIYVDYEDYRIDFSDNNNNYNNQVIKNVNINKNIKLTEGLYNLSIGLIIKGNSGINSTNFKIFNNQTNEKLLEYEPVSHLSELIEHNKFVLLDIGSFEVKNSRIKEENDENEKKDQTNKLIDIKLIVEESSITVKSGYIICFIDINGYQLKDYIIEKNGDFKSINEKYWIAWWINNEVPTNENIVNILLKRLYKSIEDSMFEINNENKYDENFKDIENINLDDYNKRFYSIFNKEGELITRTFKFRTNKDRIRYNEWYSTNFKAVKPIENEPLKWKMSTIMEL